MVILTWAWYSRPGIPKQKNHELSFDNRLWRTIFVVKWSMISNVFIIDFVYTVHILLSCLGFKANRIFGKAEVNVFHFKCVWHKQRRFVMKSAWVTSSLPYSIYISVYHPLHSFMHNCNTWRCSYWVDIKWLMYIDILWRIWIVQHNNCV